MSEPTLVPVTDDDLDHVRELFREYAAEIEIDLCFQGFEEELSSLPGRYAAPTGSLILAWDEARPIGCIGLREIAPRVAEMKRLYVRPEARGTGVGRRLVERFLEDARRLGYREVVLDTLDRMVSARALYTSLGFEVVPAYYNNPLEGVVYMRLRLDG